MQYSALYEACIELLNTVQPLPYVTLTKIYEKIQQIIYLLHIADAQLFIIYLYVFAKLIQSFLA